MNEYVVADCIYHLQNNKKHSGWCFSSRNWMATQLGITKANIVNIIDRLIIKQIIEKDDSTKYLRTMGLWFDVVIAPTETEEIPKQIGIESIPTVSNQYRIGIETIPPSDSNNININNKLLDNEKTKLPMYINMWKEINPMGYSKFFAIPVQRKATEELVKTLGAEEYTSVLAKIKETNKQQFAPQIYSPYVLQIKYQQWKDFVDKSETPAPKERMPDGEWYDQESKVHEFWEGGKLIKECKTEEEYREYLKSRGVNVVEVPEIPAEQAYHPPTDEEIQEQIKKGERKKWDF